MKNHSLQLWVLNLFLKGKHSGQNKDLSFKVVSTLLYWHTFAWMEQNAIFFCSNESTQRGKPVLKILFFWTSIFFLKSAWHSLGTEYKKKLLWDCFSFLCSVKVLPRFSKQLEKVPSFSWPCQPQRERIELEQLSSPKRHNKIHKREDDPYILRYSVHDLHGEMDEEWTQHTLELEPVLKQLMNCTEGSKPGRDCVQG